VLKHHWQNLKYLVRHKWYVLRAGLKYRVWWHQLVLHDWSKLTPSEWSGYANYFFNRDPKLKLFAEADQDTQKQAFYAAWNAHQKRNKHHWNYWVSLGDGGKTTVLEMPERFVREMVADWAGASMAIRGFDDSINWYHVNRELIMLHPKTRQLVEKLIGYGGELIYGCA
jgi:hypothetical protein